LATANAVLLALPVRGRGLLRLLLLLLLLLLLGLLPKLPRCGEGPWLLLPESRLLTPLTPLAERTKDPGLLPPLFRPPPPPPAGLPGLKTLLPPSMRERLESSWLAVDAMDARSKLPSLDKTLAKFGSELI
jgi:hypothetical protein